MDNNTLVFSLNNNKDEDMRKTLITIYDALVEKGYDPIDQSVGYILSEDPTYITNQKNARSLIRKLDRYELLSALVNNYLKG